MRNYAEEQAVVGKIFVINNHGRSFCIMDIGFFIALILIVLSVLFTIYVQVQMRKGYLKLTTEYSYKKVIITSLSFILFSIFIASAYFIYSRSLEHSLFIFIVMATCVLIGFLKGMLFEYQIKRRTGGEKS